MYVCICQGITDHKIADAIDNGANTMKKLTEQLNVGAQCGKCTSYTKQILNDKLASAIIEQRIPTIEINTDLNNDTSPEISVEAIVA